MMLTTDNTTRRKALAGKTEEEQLQMLAYFALVDLSNFYKEKGDKRQYEINKLLHSGAMK